MGRNHQNDLIFLFSFRVQEGTDFLFFFFPPQNDGWSSHLDRQVSTKKKIVPFAAPGGIHIYLSFRYFGYSHLHDHNCALDTDSHWMKEETYTQREKKSLSLSKGPPFSGWRWPELNGAIMAIECFMALVLLPRCPLIYFFLPFFLLLQTSKYISTLKEKIYREKKERKTGKSFL